MLVASVVAMLAAAATAWMLARRPGFAALVARPPALARTLFVVGALAVGVQLAWLTPFIIDPNRATWAPSPLRPMPPVHSCASCLLGRRPRRDDARPTSTTTRSTTCRRPIRRRCATRASWVG